MDNLNFLYGIAVLAAAALAAIAIRAPHALWLRMGAVALSGVIMATAYAGFAELLGRPKPVKLEWAADNMDEAMVLAADLREGEAIYLWLQMDYLPEPRAYVLPWSMEAVRQLHRAQGQAEQNGTAVRMRKKLVDGEEDVERMFYAEPQRALPPKTY
jgi:hypothetical protein